jgi:hypothetical protein
VSFASRTGRAGASVAVLLAATAAVAGCGGGVTLPDLFVVQRSGHVRGAWLTVLVNEGGGIRCGKGPAHLGPVRQLSDPQLIAARVLQEELVDPSAKHISLPPLPGSVYRYNVRDAEGWVRFADNSAGMPAVLGKLEYFVLETAMKVCGLPG